MPKDSIICHSGSSLFRRPGCQIRTRTERQQKHQVRLPQRGELFWSGSGKRIQNCVDLCHFWIELFLHNKDKESNVSKSELGHSGNTLKIHTKSIAPFFVFLFCLLAQTLKTPEKCHMD